ncbi:MAG TPA: hypothetical protein VNN77_19800 [candidate division Zixibacteria bacterium]|nr:hypothetical protein [candidate division Zixibacteria bacterium]
MPRQILVPLKPSDRIEQFLPYLEKLAQPGMRVVFLVHYGLAGLSDFTEQLLPGLPLEPSAGGRATSHDRPEDAAAIVVLCDELRRRGIEIGMSVYSGGTRRVLKDYIRSGDVDLIMMSEGPKGWMARSLQQIRSLLVSGKRRPHAPVLISIPAAATGERAESGPKPDTGPPSR